MPLKYSMLPSESPEPSDSGENSSPAGPGRQLARHRASPSRPPSLIALPPGDVSPPRPGRGRGRVLAISAVALTLVGIALFSFGMKYQTQSAPGLVDLVDPNPSRGSSGMTDFSGTGRPVGSEGTPRPEGMTSTSVAQNTYYVHVGPYRKREELLTAYLQIRKMGLESVLIPGDDGGRLQIIHTTDEREAKRLARKLFDRGFSPAVFGSDPPAAMLRSMRAATVQYGPVGIRVGFEGGQSVGWSPRGTAVGTRNSALFASDGTHSLEVLLQNTSSGAPAQVRNGSLSVVLPGDRFTVRVLQPVWWARPVTAFLFVTDAEKHVFRDIAVPLDSGHWVELKHTISQQVVLPLKEVGIQFGGDLPYTGPIYVDELEQKRPQE
jgi:SPOR domain